MKLIRRLLRYLLILAFIILLFAAYYYRALIFSEYINTRVDNAINSVLVLANIVPDQDDPSTGETQEVPDCVPAEGVTQTNETDVVKVEVEIIQPEAVDAAVNASLAGVEPAQAGLEEQASETTSEPALEQLPEEESEPVQAQEQPVNESATDNNAGAEGEEVTQKSHFELINQARHVYQCGDTSDSIDLYRELGELYPDDPNVYGELGNVFYSKGEWKQASLAYYEAALRLHKRNQQDQIHYLYRVIQGLDPETAEKLRSQLGS